MWWLLAVERPPFADIGLEPFRFAPVCLRIHAVRVPVVRGMRGWRKKKKMAIGGANHRALPLIPHSLGSQRGHSWRDSNIGMKTPGIIHFGRWYSGGRTTPYEGVGSGVETHALQPTGSLGSVGPPAPPLGPRSFMHLALRKPKLDLNRVRRYPTPTYFY